MTAAVQALWGCTRHQNYVTEARVTAKSGFDGKTLSDLLSERRRASAGRNPSRRKNEDALPDSRLRENDIVILTGAHAALDRLVKETDLALESDDRPTESEDPKTRSNRSRSSSGRTPH